MADIHYKKPRKPIDWVVVGIGIGLGVVLPLAASGDGLDRAVLIVAVGAASAILFGSAVSSFIPPRWAWPVMFAGLLTGLFVWSRLGGGWAIATAPWVMLSLAGTIIGAQLRYMWDRRMNPSSTTPPLSSPGIGPDGRSDPA